MGHDTSDDALRMEIDLGSLRRRDVPARGRGCWRSLEDLAESPEFQEILDREFPRHASVWDDGLDRRRFLQLAGASLALAGLGACTRQPLETIVPYVHQPEEIVPGRPLLFATALTLGGYALGVLVESHEGRPTKIEGNPDHPASLGGTDVFAQAAILGLYDPDRSQVLTHLGRIQTWSAFVEALTGRLKARQGMGGEGIRVLTETVTSPTLADQRRALLARFPKARWHQYEPVGGDSARAASRLAFGEPVATRFDVAQANVILALDSDFLTAGPGCVRYARDFASRRRVRRDDSSMSRLYAVETSPTSTSTLADHRLAVRAQDLPAFAAALSAELGAPGGWKPAGAVETGRAPWIRAVAADLARSAGHSLVIAGEFAPPAVHVLVHDINERLGNVGRTVIHTDPVEAEPVDQLASLRELVEDMKAGRVDLLAILGGNPVFTAPVDLGFAQAMLEVPLRFHLSLEDDETSEYCHWHVPQGHGLETWSDARSYDGTVSIIQPLIEPLYGGKSAHEVLSVLIDEAPRGGYDLLRDSWRGRAGGADFEGFWRAALHDGVVPGTALPAKARKVDAEAVRKAIWKAAAPSAVDGGSAIELVFRPDPTVHDGRFANNGWLQELPKPLTKITWENAAWVSPATAEELGLQNEQLVVLDVAGRTVRAPVWIVPGHAERSLTVHFGYGRRRSGRVGTGVGFDPYTLRTSEAMWTAPAVAVRATGERHPLATTQEHFSMEGRHLVRTGTLQEYRHEPRFAQDLEESPPKELNLYPGFAYEGHAWGMAIDLNACTGCNACVIACQAENNIPIVGKEQVRLGREMHWLRIDRYYAGSLDAPETHNQPVPCMHCEQAPCEVVCPVAATTHSSEGLNDMVYNRCVGTRYCSNNCPYKVRRFNFLEYNDEKTPVLELLRNPDVSVRSRGVMEKCTYCVQRINGVRIEAEREGRKIRDGEIVTACQQACPSEAIVFGDINDAASRVSRWKAEPTNYALLAHLNTRPRTTYLAKIRNPNPDLEPS